MEGEREYILLIVTHVGIIDVDNTTNFSKNKLINTKRSTNNFIVMFQ